MSAADLTSLTVADAGRLLAQREASSRELTQAHLDRIAAVDPKVQAFITLTPDLALRQADEADQRIAAGDAGPLTGIPAAIKDVIVTKGVRTTCGSRMLEPFVPPYDAAVIEKLQAAGVVMLGKLNMDEFAMGSSTENSAFFPTRNPWDLARVPGGSSGGSAAAVASGMAMFALGSDTGGSIRQPAGLCGVTGIKPTYGRVSRYGLVAFASSLDQIGPLARTVEDCALVLNAVCGHDERDSTSAPMAPPDFTESLQTSLKGVRIGVPAEYLPANLQPGVRQAVEAALGDLERLGAEIDTEVSLPSTGATLAAYYVIAPSEASANLARYDGVKYGFSYQQGESMWDNMERTRQIGFGDEVKRRIMLGTYALSAGYYDAYYLKALKVRTVIRREFEAAFQRLDAIVGPVSPTTAFKLGEKVDDPYEMYLSDVFTLPVNIAGLPGMSVPCGFHEGLPVGLQIIGKPFDETTVLRIGHAYQQATDWHRRMPSLP